jgi:hypothetical protein
VGDDPQERDLDAALDLGDDLGVVDGQAGLAKQVEVGRAPPRRR